MTTPSGDLLRPPSPFMSWFPLQFDRLHEAPKRNKADFGGRQQIIFQATGELAGPAAVPKAHKRQLRRKRSSPRQRRLCSRPNFWARLEIQILKPGRKSN
jgi:hypothetical protein